MSEAAHKPNPSLQKKSAARLAAVQALYTLAMTGEERTPEQMVSTLKKQLANNREEQKLLVGAPIEPNYKLVESILAAVEKWRSEIDVRLDSVLQGNWKRERMSKLLVAILQCSIAELYFDKDLSPKIVTDEYTRLTRGFLGEEEADFVHAALHKLAPKP